MTEFPETRYSLLEELRSDSERNAWGEFVEIYQPVIYRIARRRGLQDADALDLTQQVTMSVMGAIGRWEKSDHKARFRHWLRRVAKNAVINALSRKPLDQGQGGTGVNLQLNQQPETNNATTEDLFEVERKRELYNRAARIVQADVEDSTWQAFHLTAVDNMTVPNAAEKLNKSVATIYAARSRIMKRLQTELAAMEQQEDE